MQVDSVACKDIQLVGNTLVKAVNSYNKSFNNKHTLCKVGIIMIIIGIKAHYDTILPSYTFFYSEK